MTPQLLESLRNLVAMMETERSELEATIKMLKRRIDAEAPAVRITAGMTVEHESLGVAKVLRLSEITGNPILTTKAYPDGICVEAHRCIPTKAAGSHSDPGAPGAAQPTRRSHARVEPPPAVREEAEGSPPSPPPPPAQKPDGRKSPGRRVAFTQSALKDIALLRDEGMLYPEISKRFFSRVDGTNSQPSGCVIAKAVELYGRVGKRTSQAAPVVRERETHVGSPEAQEAAGQIERVPQVSLPVVKMVEPQKPEVAGPVDIQNVKWACVIGMDALGLAVIQVLREHHIQAVVQDRRSGMEFRSAVRLLKRLSVNYFFNCREIQKGYDLYISTDQTPLSASLPQMTPRRLADAFPDCPFAREVKRLAGEFVDPVEEEMEVEVDG